MSSFPTNNQILAVNVEAGKADYHSRYIANHHWPVPTQSDTHLNIQAKYRNALFYEQIRASRPPPLPLQEQVKQPSPPPPPPSEHATESESGADDVPPLEPGTSFAQGMQGMKKKLTNATAKVFSNFVARSSRFTKPALQWIPANRIRRYFQA